MDTNDKVFSSEAEFELSLRKGGSPTVTRFPTDQEWADRHKAVKTVIVRVGSGTKTNSEGVEQADQTLLNKIRVSGEEVDEFDASVLISKLTRAEGREAVAVPAGYEIPVVVVGNILTGHTLRVPTAREMRSYRRGAFVFVDMRHGKQELRTAPLAIGEFYDLLKQSTRGYAPGSAVPLAHKSAAVIELTQTVDALDQEDDPETFI